MASYSGLDGQIRIYDSTPELRSEAGGDVEVYDATGPSFTDKTSEARSAASSLTGDFCADTGDYLYIGHTSPFGRIQVDLDTVAVASGALVVEYYDGDSWETLDVTDGTDDGTDCLAQDGAICFIPPADWAMQGDAGLDSDKYYVRLSTTDVPSQAPDAEQIWPIDGQYLDLIFDGMDLQAPGGRPRPEQTLVHHRGRLSSYSHYLSSSDAKLVEPLDFSCSVRLDTVVNRLALMQALTCGNPNLSTAWDATGVSTKTDSMLLDRAGTLVHTPAFDDTTIKAVCVQILWTKGGVSYGKMFNEVWFPESEQQFQEAEDAVTVSLAGLIYGSIEDIYWFAYPY
jgi:hypothetical protein